MMRHENQPWNAVQLTAEVSTGGTQHTGLTIEAVLQRADGMWLQSGGGWGGAPSTLTLAEVSAANLPGLYEFSVPIADLTLANGVGGYRAKLIENPKTNNFEEHVRIETRTSVEGFRAASRLGQNYRIVYTSFNAAGAPTAGTAYLYADRTTALADTTPFPNALENFPFTGTYDSENRVTEFVSVEAT